MKKYITPVLEVINLSAEESVLATSGVGISDDSMNPGGSRAPGLGYFDDEDEE